MALLVRPGVLQLPLNLFFLVAVATAAFFALVLSDFRSAFFLN